MDNVREAKVFNHTFAAITTNGDLYCWGYNTSGQTGMVTSSDSILRIKYHSQQKITIPVN